MFDFATKNVEIRDIIEFYKLKKALVKKMENEKDNESVEERYNDAKRRF